MKPIRALAAVVLALAAISLLVAVALNLANIVGRYVFFSPIASAEEVMLFLFVGTVFLGNSYVGWKGRQIRMDVFSSFCRRRGAAGSTSSPTSP
jgi:TRAP-type C4-dicarboxylate transport system permease small subunit